MLTNRPRNFHETSLIETGLSDCHKMIVSLFRDFLERLPAKVKKIKYLIIMNSYEISTKNSSKVIHATMSNNMTYLHQFFERY